MKLRKRTIVSILIITTHFCLFSVSYAQNLVPNPSFESYSTCPDYNSQLDYSNSWTSPTTGTPDYFNACCPVSGSAMPGNNVSTPNNFGGVQTPRTGQSYVGIYTKITPPAGPTLYREYIMTQLTCPLVAGVTYDIGFYVSRGEKMDLATDKIGLHLSNGPLSSTNSEPLPVVPQIQNPAGNIIINSSNWTLISGTYTAVGGESYLTIGNFSNDAQTQEANANLFAAPGGMNNYYYKAYYFIEDAYVIPQNQPVPIFNPVGPICAGEVIPPLPTTSLNGITGTWSPALNNMATTTYTFTPSSPCFSSVTMTITVNPNSTTPTFAQVAPICAGEVLSPLPTTSQNGISGTWSPALNNTTTTTYNFTPDAGQCADPTTMTITVNPTTSTPTFAQVAPICAGEALAPLPINSQNGITGNWSPALNNTATTSYTFTPDPGQCAAIVTMTITVNQPTIPTFTQIAPICSGEALSPLPTNSLNGITGNWSPALDNTTTTSYTFTPDPGQCATTAILTITVNPILTPTFPAVPATICAGEVLSPLPTSSVNGVTGTWSPATNNTETTSYTFSPDAGQCATTTALTITVNPVVTTLFTPVAPVCSGEVLSELPTTSLNGITGNWSPALNNVTTTTYTFTPSPGQCALENVTTIIVHPSPTARFTFLPQDQPSSFHFIDQSAGNVVSWGWNFGDHLGSSTIQNPFYQYSDKNKPHNVTLLVTSDFGCVDSVSHLITIKEEPVYYVPNAFSPDGDEFNSVFKPVFTYGFDSFDYHLSIYNRWGELIFESHNAMVGWDGTYNGTLVQAGIYIWTIDFGVIETDERRSINGHVNLLR